MSRHPRRPSSGSDGFRSESRPERHSAPQHGRHTDGYQDDDRGGYQDDYQERPRGASSGARSGARSGAGRDGAARHTRPSGRGDAWLDRAAPTVGLDDGWPAARKDARKPPRRGFRAMTTMLLLAGLVLTLSGVLEIAGAFPWPFGATNAASLVEAVPTRTPTPTPTKPPTPKPTKAPTPKPTSAPQPVYIPPADSYSLGCAGGTHPAPDVIRNGQAAHGVALTFDDGPSPDYTATMLTTLEQTHTPATFFVVGSNAAKYPNLIQREAKDGALGMHTYDHPFMTRLSPTSRAWELTATLQAVHAAVGPNYCLQFWRPPFGDYNNDVLTLSNAMGLTTVTWSVDPQDWASPGVQVIVDRVLQYAQPGSIILLHDGYVGRWQTAQALPLIIQGLKKKGLVPVTVPQLLAGGQ